MKPIGLILALVLVVGACGDSGSDSEVASLEGSGAAGFEEATSDDLDADAEEAILAFAQCMRDNGVPDFPDPSMDASGNLNLFGGGGRGDLGVDRDTLSAAFDECASLIEGIVQNFRNTDLSELEDTFLEFAECMRDEGIDMADPDFSGGFGPGAGGRGGLFGDVDPQDPAFQAAAEECQGVFEGGFGPGGFGAGGGAGGGAGAGGVGNGG